MMPGYVFQTVPGGESTPLSALIALMLPLQTPVYSSAVSETVVIIYCFYDGCLVISGIYLTSLTCR